MLDDDNFRELFKNHELWLKARGWLYVFEQSVKEYTHAAKDSGSSSQKEKEKFERHEASARYYTRQLLNTFDRELFDSIPYGRDGWEAVKAEYQKSTAKDVRKLEKQITHWKKEKGLSVKRAWVQLKELRSNLVEIDSTKTAAYTETSLFGYLLEGLDNDIYKTAKNVLDMQPNLTRKEMLDSLQNFYEENEKSNERDLSALAARYTAFNRGSSRPSNQRSTRDPSWSPTRSPFYNTEGKETCYICNGPGHHARHCEFKHETRRYGESLRLEKEAQNRSTSRKAPANTNPHRPFKRKSVKFADKSKAFWSETEAETDGEWTEGDQSDFMTDDEEVAALITEEVRKSFSLSDTFISDTGCTNDMTDQRRLFISDLTPIKRRWIKVGRGRLFSDFMGDVILRCPDGSSGVLPNALLVEGLGVNLLSAKKMCQRNNAIGYFDNEKMLFRDHENNLILSAKLENGLYNVDHVAGPKERALCCEELSFSSEEVMPMNIDSVGETSQIGGENIDEGKRLYSRAEILEKRRAERYWLHHRRCGHAGPRVISLLHTVTDIDRPINVPPNLELCDVCLATKMKKFRSKKLANHKNIKLGLISIDIAGPFPLSIDGHKYFAEIVDSYSRKKWILLLKDKSKIVEALDEWGNIVERQTGCRIMAVRSDNAGEILKILKSWKRNNGVVPQNTAPYSSHQNGVAERAIQSTIYATRAMLKEAGLPVEFWAEAARTHTYITNRIRAGPKVAKTIEGKEIIKKVSPEEAWSDNPVTIKHFKDFGCKAFAHIDQSGLEFSEGQSNSSPAIRRQIGRPSNLSKPFNSTKLDAGIGVGIRAIVPSISETDDNVKITQNFSSTETSSEPKDKKNKPPPILDELKKTGKVKEDGSISFSNSNALPLDAVNVFQSDSKELDLNNIEGKISEFNDQTNYELNNNNYIKNTDQDDQDNDYNEESYRAIEGLQAVTLTISSTSTNPIQGKQNREVNNLRRSRRLQQKAKKLKNTSQITNHENDNNDQDSEKWMIPIQRELEDITMSDENFRTLTEQYPLIQDSHGQLNQNRKRKLDNGDDDDDTEYRSAKLLKAMLAILDLSDNEDDMNIDNAFLTETLISAALVCEDVPVPRSYKQAINDPIYGKMWKEAIEEEIRALTMNQTWEEIVAPADANLISTKWVFTVKLKSDGSLDSFKARLVARGFTQRFGTDYKETFAPTVQMATLRAFLAICAVEDLELFHFDIKNSFTEASPNAALFLRAPEGVRVKPGRALKVLRSLYGLKQAARDWNQLLKKKVLEWGFIQSLADPCLFTNMAKDVKLLLYVDDIAVAAKSSQQINWLFKQMNRCFKTKNLGEMEMFLGMRITRNRKDRTLWLDQQQYLERILTKFGIPKARHRPASTPIEGYENLSPASDDELRIDPTEYSMIIGSLMFAMVYTRADIAFALGRLSQYMKEPTEKHGRALKRLMRYLRSTSDYRLCFNPKESVNLVVYSDAD
ncbi:hypothetical protein K3495_g5013 [Podosphaera aphanis]|nr:hypothetical protein K3495_g5013 [Podosphaera aphanis]